MTKGLHRLTGSRSRLTTKGMPSKSGQDPRITQGNGHDDHLLILYL